MILDSSEKDYGMESQSNYRHTDAVKSISNILRDPVPPSGGEVTSSNIVSKSTPAPASQSRDESSEMAAQPSTFASHHNTKPPALPSGSHRLRGALWRFLVHCVEPIFCRVRNYLLTPLHVKLDTATEHVQLQVQVIRADLEFLPKQLAQVEFRSRNYAKQLAQLESQLGVLTDQLKRLQSRGGSEHGQIEFLAEPNYPVIEDELLGPSLSKMNSNAVVIIGSGGHAKVVIELVRAEGKYQIKGCTGLGERGFVLGDVPILGTDSVLPALLANGTKKAFVAIGENSLRLRLLAQVSEMGFDLINAISPNAVVSPSAILGRGIAIMAGAIINASSQIGDGAIINTNAGVDHDCRIGNGAHIGPESVLAGNVEIGCETFLGVGACVIPGIRIGSRTIVGAGSVVVRDLPDGVTAMGVPARITS
jgi:UDP-perosamine 4-acetyltransferase